MYRVLTCFIVMLCASPAGWASCAYMPDASGKMPWDSDKSVTVADHWAARHVREGMVSGCLALFKETGGKTFTAYTSYDFICALPAGETITVRQSFACCDTGEDGDYVCGIKPVNPLADFKQTPIGVIPAKPDRRAIANLMDRLEMVDWIRTSNITQRLAEYAAVPELQAEIKGLAPRLRSIMARAKEEQKKAAIAELLLSFEPQSKEEHDDRLDLALQILRGVSFGELGEGEKRALETVKSHTEAGEKVVPVLVNLLRQTAYREESRLAAMDALRLFSAALQPHLTEIHYILRDDLFEQTSISAAMAENDKFDWYTANHRDRNDANEIKRYQAMRDEQRKELEEKLKRSVKWMPLWQQLVCTAFPLPLGVQARRIVWDTMENIAPVDCPPVPKQ